MNRPDEERVQPIKITDKETGKVYKLDFCRKAIDLMSQNKFSFDENTFNYLATDGPKLFYYALMCNDEKISHFEADKLYREKLGGITPLIAERLFMLYNQALNANNVFQTDEDLEKNAQVAVEM